jgi:hypothetical protein
VTAALDAQSQTVARDYARGEAAIKTLFPDARYAGNANLFFSQIRTLAGGDINLMVPGGSIVAGLASPPSGFTKKPTELGIVVQSAGRVQALSKEDFLVNQSRVFTLRGGDLLIWSQAGNIDAGKGAKTAVSAPPPVLIIDSNGNVSFDVQGAANGSGIALPLTRPGDVAGTTYLVAPEGEVIAGDAGIRSQGNLQIQAVRVVGADNIQVSGRSTGVPVADTGGLSGSVASLGSTATDAVRSADAATRSLSDMSQSQQAAKEAFRSFLVTVQITCLGDECPR